MHNDEILNDLSLIPPTSLLAPWKTFILAVDAFYRNEEDLCLDLVKSIAAESAPSAFKPLFLNIMKKRTIPDEWSKLAAAILENNRELSDSLNLIKDSSEIEDVLLDTAEMVIKIISREDSETALKIMIWCLEHLQESEMLSDKALTKVKKLFGDQEGYRLAALTSLSFDPDRSLVYWLHSLIAYLEQRNTKISFVKAYLNIISDTAESVKLEFELTDEYIMLLTSLISELSVNLYHIYPEIQGTSVLSNDPFQDIFLLAGKNSAPLHPRKTRDSVKSAIQLELFAI
jgi:hypothetical protein